LYNHFDTTFSLILSFCFYSLSHPFHLYYFWPMRRENNKVASKVVPKWLLKYHYSKNIQTKTMCNGVELCCWKMNSTLRCNAMVYWKEEKNDIEERGVEWVQHCWSMTQRDTWHLFVGENRRVHHTRRQQTWLSMLRKSFWHLWNII